ncbi:transcriptional regulator, ArsR family [Corynebacterium appendicis CIP 107643]|uniref:Transcriptional regulator, ArsR family n=1 Tax=Corynebacterium appendicis CIP 107643 TaxID=1161099 RepID=A0A1N7JXF1_9CORY|nr:metalloregulator ArsR/SmtB family transcription factor [Corynebacterium appendicis]WJY60587.1 HTH-type transcriptional repressor CzrA [Corynebacterium appendicis CIP 107643]SIS54008.1 transcriptional regulator, ArsR family [Corynebacterium appendicis CIP 107643]
MEDWEHDVNILAWTPVFKTLSDPTRLALLSAIHFAGPEQLAVSELSDLTGTKMATTSAALRAMEKTGVVRSIRDGRSIYYAIADEQVHTVLHWIGATHKH